MIDTPLLDRVEERLGETGGKENLAYAAAWDAKAQLWCVSICCRYQSGHYPLLRCATEKIARDEAEKLNRGRLGLEPTAAAEIIASTMFGSRS